MPVIHYFIILKNSKNSSWKHGVEWPCENKKTNGIFITGFSGIASPYWVSGFKDIYWNINKNIMMRL